MGVVYRAHDALLEREVALKVISASIEGNPELRERFFREARAAGQLSHRNIITIHDLGEHEGQPYLAMEFLAGEDLQHCLSRHEPMTLARKLEIAAEICEGLSYAHRRGLIHRDIKPANIFITNDGVVKLLDFGLARMVTSELTASNMMLGTLNYMAPEQVRGERTDHRADIFSFGVVLYEILSGRKAFQGDSFATTLYKILQDVPEPLQNIDASLPAEVVRLVERAIAKSKEERYQDLGDLARDLALHRQHLALSDSDTMAIPVPTAFRSPATQRSGSDPPCTSGVPVLIRPPAEVGSEGDQPVGADDSRRRDDQDRAGGEPGHDHAIVVVDRRRDCRDPRWRGADQSAVASTAGVRATDRDGSARAGACHPSRRRRRRPRPRRLRRRWSCRRSRRRQRATRSGC